MQQTALMEEVVGWIHTAAEQVRQKMQQPLQIEEKSSHSDLVTNVDKETEAFLVSQIQTAFPNDQIMGEEGTGGKLTSLNGRVWFIDPIDGTLNFVKQRANFCIMVAIYEQGKGLLGFIYDVMADEFAYGGKETGVFLNGQQLSALPKLCLEDSLLGLNPYMYAHNQLNAYDIAEESSGVRMTGCAGVEFLSILKGQTSGYISRLSPWDYAAGKVLLEALGGETARLDGQSLNLLDREPFLGATKQVFDEIKQKYFSI